MQQLGIRFIDMVVVNLYGLVDVIAESGTESIPSVESIDIAGPSLIRSAAKNYTQVAAVTDPGRYDAVAEELERNDRELSEETHFALALEAFRHTAHYDTLVVEYLTSLEGET
jgi:phosphoribosylaminoimidazolecarboxamide formyltransferase/IMP cyclohydrolase